MNNNRHRSALRSPGAYLTLLLSTLVLTLALGGQARAVTYYFVGFYQQDWFFRSPPPHTVGNWGGYGTTSAADLDTIQDGVFPVTYTSYANSTVAQVLRIGWSGCGPSGCCPADDMSIGFQVYAADTMQPLGIVTVGHLTNIALAEGGWAWNGVQIGTQYPTGSGCSEGPHSHVEKTSPGEWINICTDPSSCSNNSLQAAIRWTLYTTLGARAQVALADLSAPVVGRARRDPPDAVELNHVNGHASAGWRSPEPLRVIALFRRCVMPE